MAGSSDSGGEEAKYPANMPSFASVPLGSLANPKLKAKTALQFLLRAVSSPAERSHSARSDLLSCTEKVWFNWGLL